MTLMDTAKIARACHNRHVPSFMVAPEVTPLAFKKLFHLVTSSIDIRMIQKTNDSATAYNKHYQISFNTDFLVSFLLSKLENA